MKTAILSLVLTIAAHLSLAASQPGYKVYHIGNSHTDTIRNGLKPLAVAAGHAEHTFSMSRILGASLTWIREHDKECAGEPWSKGLAPERSWDVLTLQSYNNTSQTEIDAAVFFAGMALKGNPQCQIYMYTIWPDGSDDWEKPKDGRTEEWNEKVADEIGKAYPQARPVRVLPTSLVIRELGKLADAGELPGVPNRFALLADGGHLSHFGAYAANATFCAAIYGESPIGYPAPVGAKDHVPTYTGPAGQYQVPAETAAVIQRVVWDVLYTYPRAGLKVGLVVADRGLPVAVVGQTYTHRLSALNADEKARWSLAGGELPAGVTLAADGRLSGQPQAAGKFNPVVQIEVGGAKATRPLRLTVCENTPPRVTTAELAPVRLDEYVFRTLEAQGGVGKLTWSVADGKLPAGVVLSVPGVLTGTPGESGDFRFTVKVEDSNPSGPRAATKSYQWTIKPADAETMAVAGPVDPPQVDGKLDEAFWKLDQPVAKKAVGEPTKQASFGAAWFQAEKKNAKRGAGLAVAVRVQDGPAGRTKRDAVHVYWDALHNKEVIYNADDTHLVIGRDGKVQSLRGRPAWGTTIKAAVTETGDGWIAEFFLTGQSFYGGPVPFGPKAVYGFDIGVEAGEKERSLLLWRGTDKNDEDPSQFGTIVLTQ